MQVPEELPCRSGVGLGPGPYYVADPLYFCANRYWDGGIPGREDLYGEADWLLGWFPDLRVIFAHFMSDDLERTARFVDGHPLVSLDLALVPDLHMDLTQPWEQAQGFFIRYQGGIILGTDGHVQDRGFRSGASPCRPGGADT